MESAPSDHLPVTASPAAGSERLPLRLWLFAGVLGYTLCTDVLVYSFTHPFLPQHLDEAGYSTPAIAAVTGVFWWSSIVAIFAHMIHTSYKESARLKRGRDSPPGAAEHPPASSTSIELEAVHAQTSGEHRNAKHRRQQGDEESAANKHRSLSSSSSRHRHPRESAADEYPAQSAQESDTVGLLTSGEEPDSASDSEHDLEVPVPDSASAPAPAPAPAHSPGAEAAFTQLSLCGRTLKLSHAKRRQLLVAVALAIHTSTTCVCGLLPVYPVIFAARTAQGVASAFSWIFALTLVTDFFPASHRALAMAIIFAGNNLGEVLGPVIGGAVFSATGLRGPFFVASAIGGLNLLLFALLASHINRQPAVHAQRHAATPAAPTSLPATPTDDPGKQLALQSRRSFFTRAKTKLFARTLGTNAATSVLHEIAHNSHASPAGDLQKGPRQDHHHHHHHQQQQQTRAPIRFESTLRDPVIIALSMMIMVVSMVRALTDVILPLFIDHQLYLSEFYVSLVFGAQAASSCIGTFLIGTWAAKKFNNASHPIIAVLVAYSLSAMVIFAYQQYVFTVVVALTIGVWLGSISILASKAISDRADELAEFASNETIMTTFNMLWFLGFGLGAFLGGAPPSSDGLAQLLTLAVMAGVQLVVCIPLFVWLWNRSTPLPSLACLWKRAKR